MGGSGSLNEAADDSNLSNTSTRKVKSADTVNIERNLKSNNSADIQSEEEIEEGGQVIHVDTSFKMPEGEKRE